MTKCDFSDKILFNGVRQPGGHRQCDCSSPGEQISGDSRIRAAFTDAACFTFNRLTTSTRQQLFRELFHPSEMNLNVCRTCIGASDYSSNLYSYDDGDADTELNLFSIDHDREYILLILREARKANLDLFLFSSPWSPPGWTKSGRSMLGGSMRRRYLPVYAQYFLKFVRAYADAGVPIQAITVQNEATLYCRPASGHCFFALVRY